MWIETVVAEPTIPAFACRYLVRLG